MKAFLPTRGPPGSHTTSALRIAYSPVRRSFGRFLRVPPLETTPPSPPSDSGQPSIHSTIAVLVEELGAESIVELLQTFLDETPDRIEELRQLAGGTEQSVLQRAAHSLKGTAALFGVSDLEAAAFRLEQSAALAETEGQVAEAAAILAAFERNRPVLEEALRGLAP